MFGVKKSDVQSKEYLDMKEFTLSHDETPDGAFFAMAQECGWEYEDWGWYAEVQEFDPDFK